MDVPGTRKVAKLTKPARLGDGHIITSFDCGEDVLNVWLKKRALAANAARTANTFVVCRGKRVVGYFSLANGAVAHKDASAKVRQNTPDPIPAIVLARLAVDKAEAGKGLGEDLLQEAGKRALAGANHSAARILIVHALNERALKYYEKHGFRSIKSDDAHTLYISLDTLASSL